MFINKIAIFKSLSNAFDLLTHEAPSEQNA